MSVKGKLTLSSRYFVPAGARPACCPQPRLVQWLQHEDRVARCEIVECFHRRSFWHREKALNLAGEAVEIGFEDRRPQVRRKLARTVALADQRADQHDLACRARIAHPVGVAAGADQIALSGEIERVDGQRNRPGAGSSADFENVEMPAHQANSNEKNQRTAKDAVEGPRLQIA